MKPQIPDTEAGVMSSQKGRSVLYTHADSHHMAAMWEQVGARKATQNYLRGKKAKYWAVFNSSFRTKIPYIV